MKFSNAPCAAIVVGALTVLSAKSAFAQADARLPPAGYADRDVGGDRIVEFNDDPIGLMPFEIAGDGLVRAPHVIRCGLIQPRLNFVVELLKSVENL